MTQYIIDTKNIAAHADAPLGGKAANLFRLQTNGIEVPEFICVSAQAFTQSTAQAETQIKQLLDSCDYSSLSSLTQVSKAIKSLILSCELSPELTAQLEQSLSSLNSWDRFSVRSSAVNEDGTQSSFAGQLGTWLNVSRDQIIDKIKACWASAYEPGVLTYMHKRKDIQHDSNPVAVVIQRMIDAESAGVMFQADPQNGIDKLAIAAGYGLGEGIVGDKVESDLYLYHKPTKEWQLNINTKHRKIIYHPETGTQEAAVEVHQQEQPVLTESQRHELLQASDNIARIYDTYQDIEWAFDQNGQLYILQSRPITTIPFGEERIFDNCNIVESYPGVISPMTFSIVRLDYYHCMRGALLALGIPTSVIDSRDEVLRNLVGYINGRAYYNIGNWYRVFLTFPYAQKRLIQYFEQMVGTDGSFSESLNDTPLTPTERLQSAIMFPVRFLYHSLRHNKLIKNYFSVTHKIQKDFEAIDLAATSADELIGALHDFVQRFTRAMSAPLTNDFYAMLFMAVTREAFAATKIPDSENLLNRLLANQAIESTKPVESINQLINIVRHNDNLKSYLQTVQKQPDLNQPEQLTQALHQQGFSQFASLLKTHIDRYGHRSPKELIMEAKTFRESPFLLLNILLQSASQETPEPIRQEDAEQALNHHLKHTRHSRLLKWLLKKTRQSIAHREATRLDRGLHFSFFRTLLHHIGERLVSDNVIAESDDIYYLTVSELNDFRQGCGVTDDLKSIVAMRKQQTQQWLQKTQEGKVYTRGCVYANTIPDIRLNLQSDLSSLQGVGCSDGLIHSTARIIKDPSQDTDIKGKIMVSETTDPGWVFLMTLSAGLISERGSLLSHTAIIGRELGIPTIVGVKNATQYIADGSEISMNGKTGEIHLQASKKVA
ncbi:PEP/pyruvate-binding domain-containing protein [Vibrio mangrovi]|uniref:PEP/pyruvate-binding domain-containing protein n=1 Tax=Vibrio mangrovi TaxID=474394 RepID=A0A1Y6IMV8_9VIBR|nr:PEP/pyruvate-binding domain-containing protein [Vibrio mangrovi]MDW6004194.1 PEP/pyruvate-binding domain-containing protein [Vibrio mangrovi]SMR99009.1 Phosphoenolpyruvate synthase [Vibrio mangrovi]